MISFDIHLQGDGFWPDLLPDADGKPKFSAGKIKGVAALPGGTVSGKPTVSFRVETESGEVIIAETTMRLFLAAAKAFEARFGAELE